MGMGDEMTEANEKDIRKIVRQHLYNVWDGCELDFVRLRSSALVLPTSSITLRSKQEFQACLEKTVCTTVIR
jgi:hypothetical protein